MTDTMLVDLGAGRARVQEVTYPSNSRKPKQEPADKPQVESVVTGEVTQRKKGAWNRARESFISEDTGSVGQYIVLEVLLPAAKNMISDAVSKGIDALLFGEGSRIRPARGDRPGGYVNYTAVRQARRTEPSYGVISPRGRATHEFDEVIIPTRGEAEDVLAGLIQLLGQYQVATVQDFYSLVGITGNFTDEKWGWYDLQGASIRPVRGGYRVDLPRTQSIE
jgi:hypothetical protein